MSEHIYTWLQLSIFTPHSGLLYVQLTKITEALQVIGLCSVGILRNLKWISIDTPMYRSGLTEIISYHMIVFVT